MSCAHFACKLVSFEDDKSKKEFEILHVGVCMGVKYNEAKRATIIRCEHWGLTTPFVSREDSVTILCLMI